MHLLPRLLQTLQLRSHDSGPTSMQFFTDSACGNTSFVVQTETNIANGTCGSLTGDGVNSVNITLLYPGCTVTTYSGPWCTYDDTLVTFGNCTSRPIGSYSVDCPDINGTVNGTYTTIPAAASSSTFSGSSPSSTFESPSASFQQDSSTAVQSASPPTISPSSPTTTGNAASRTSKSSSSAPSSSIQTPRLSTVAFQSPTSSPPSSSLSSTSSSPSVVGSSAGAGNQQIQRIVPSVAIPVAIVISVMIYVIWTRKSKSGKPTVKDEDDRKKFTQLMSGLSSGNQLPPEPDTVDNTASGTAPASDARSANSDFSSIHRFRQAELIDRTAEAGSR